MTQLSGGEMLYSTAILTHSVLTTTTLPRNKTKMLPSTPLIYPFYIFQGLESKPNVRGPQQVM